MATRFDKARFHINYGPKSLFDRVMFKMQNVTELQLSGTHFNARYVERNIPDEVFERISHFSVEDWRLVTSEVRTDKGKFVNSTWELINNGERYWITIGFNSIVETIVLKDSNGTDNVVKTGELYDFVDKTNKQLMESENLCLTK